MQMHTVQPFDRQ